LKNGQTHVREAQHAKGGPEIPMAKDELRAKFSDCARRVLDEERIGRALAYIERLETLKNIAPLCDLLRG
jgi:2-methylcitrate dehydratase PrpD